MTRVEIRKYSTDMYYKFDEGINGSQYDEFILFFGKRGYGRGWKKAEKVRIEQLSDDDVEFPIHSITVTDEYGDKHRYEECYLSCNGNIINIEE